MEGMRPPVLPAILLAALAAGGCASELGAGPGDAAADAAVIPDAPAVPDAPPATPDAAPSCTEGDDRRLGGPQGSCYMLFATAAVWTDARDACAALVPPAHLIIVTSVEENTFFAPLVARTPPDHFMGASDLAVEGTFVWVDDSAIVYDNWRLDPPEPNDGGDGPAGNAEDCMIVEGDTAATWDDRPCTSAYPYVCERDAP